MKKYYLNRFMNKFFIVFILLMFLIFLKFKYLQDLYKNYSFVKNYKINSFIKF